jgi:hypothetical protein
MPEVVAGFAGGETAHERTDPCDVGEVASFPAATSVGSTYWRNQLSSVTGVRFDGISATFDCYLW